jgi:hypothetical protein
LFDRPISCYLTQLGKQSESEKKRKKDKKDLQNMCDFLQRLLCAWPFERDCHPDNSTNKKIELVIERGG